MNIPEDKVLDMDEVKDAIKSSSDTSSIYIGADSKQFTDKDRKHCVVYVTVVIIHFDSNSGAKIYKQYHTERDYGSLRRRLMREVELAINVAYELIDVVEDRPFQVHLDINTDPKHKSYACVKEATGYVMGMLGFQPQLKPNAFAASTVSDKWAVKEATKRKRYKSS